MFVQTIPQFIAENRHLLVSLLFIDLDLYEPTKVAIENFLPRMPKGAIIAFDDLDNPMWPGETLALLETVGLKKSSIEAFGMGPIYKLWDPGVRAQARAFRVNPEAKIQCDGVTTWKRHSWIHGNWRLRSEDTRF